MEWGSTHSLEEMSPTMECLWDLLPHTGLQWTIISVALVSLRAHVGMEYGLLQQRLYLQVMDITILF